MVACLGDGRHQHDLERLGRRRKGARRRIVRDPKALRAYPPGVISRAPAHHGPTASLAELTLASYPDPVPTDTLEEFRRAKHEDLEAMTLEDLDRERAAAILRHTHAPDRETMWFRERRLKLDAFAARRRAAGR